MRKIKTLRVYNLVNSKGNKLQLHLGVITEGLRDEQPLFGADKGYRWRFIGDEIPMPVRSMYWFNGFEESIMLNWLKGNGWHPRTRVEMSNGRATVYELPKANEETAVTSADFPPLSRTEKWYFDSVIRNLVSNGNRVGAARLYRYAHGGTLKNAVDAVNVIITE